MELLTDNSEPEVRRALAATLPELSITRLAIRSKHVSSNPLYWSSSAVVNDSLVAKFAWSEVRAERVHREGVLIERLRKADRRLRLPELVACNDSPVLVVTHRADGDPLGFGAGSELEPERVAQVASDLADFLSALHNVPSNALLVDLPTVVPRAQSDTGMLRSRYPRLVDEQHARRLLDWYAWIDDVLATSDDPVLVHGDLHGDNVLWDGATGALAVVVDFEECGVADRHFDFRCIPGTLGSTDLVLAVADAYRRRCGTALHLDRVMAWHALTVLGDALWRTEAGIELPGGGDATTYVDDLEARLERVDVTT